MDRRVAQFGVRGMCQLAVRGKLKTQGAFASEREMIFRGLAVDEETRATRVCGRRAGAGAVALFANDKEQREVALAGGEQFFRGGDHRRDDAFGVASAASPDEVFVFAGSKKRRNGIHVRGKRNDGLPKADEKVVAIGLRRDALDAAV